MKSKLLISFIVLSFSVFGQDQISDVSWQGVIPALVAIVISIVSKQVILSLLLAIISGTIILHFQNAFVDSYFLGIEKSIDHYIIGALSNEDHMSVVVFSILISAMVFVVRKTGGITALIVSLSRYVKNKRSALLTTYFMGMVVFFDDYANTLIVGNTMKSVTDRFKISREKLAYVVDATSAPIACIALVSTWIGFEVQQIDEGLKNVGQLYFEESGYQIFLSAIKYSFYPIITLVFVFLLILTQKDFGPMLKAEEESKEVKENNDIEKRGRAWKGIIPIIILLVTTVYGIYITGHGVGFFDKFQSGNTYKGLLWGSSFSLIFTVVINLNAHSFGELMNWVLKGVVELLPAVSILILAWALNAVLSDLHLGEYLSDQIQSSGIALNYIPLLTFVISSIIAFSTGSSFSTMGILFPIVIAICISFINRLPMEEFQPLFYCSIASVLSGAVLGDHCSPISDTTILSSLSTGCDHVSHVRTQLPYAIAVGLISIVLILLSSVFFINTYIVLCIGVILSYLIIRLLGK